MTGKPPVVEDTRVGVVDQRGCWPASRRRKGLPLTRWCMRRQHWRCAFHHCRRCSPASVHRTVRRVYSASENSTALPQKQQIPAVRGPRGGVWLAVDVRLVRRLAGGCRRCRPRWRVDRPGATPGASEATTLVVGGRASLASAGWHRVGSRAVVL